MEGKKEYGYSSPIGTYYGEQGNTQADNMQRMINDYVSRTDPQKQAEEDARIQRGRNFWTGANLFANVVANAINVNGTAKGAPNMTWNDDARKRMYATWQDADKELKADRRAAQQRLEALQMQDEALRAKGAEQRASENKNIYDINFKIGQEQAKYDRAKADEQEKWERNQQAAREAADIAYERQKELARMRHPGGGGKSGSSGTDGIIISLGSAEIPAKDKKEAEKIRKDIANKIVERHNAGVEARNAEKKKNNRFIDEKELEKPLAKPKNDKESEGIIYQLGGMYDEDDGFRKDINEAYGIEDIYSDNVGNPDIPEFEQFAGHSVRPDESSLPDPRRYAGTAQNQTPRAYRGNPVTWNTPAKPNKREDPNDFFRQ